MVQKHQKVDCKNLSNIFFSFYWGEVNSLLVLEYDV